MALVLGTSVRRAIWWLILLLSVSNAGMLVTWARVYYKNETRDSLLWVIRVYYLYFDGNSFLLRSSHIIATGYAILAGLFTCVGLRLVLYTLASGQLRFGAMTSRISKRLSSVAILHSTQKTPQNRNQPALSERIRARILYLYDAFGIHGQYFEVRLVLDELLELGTQTISAYSSSQSISNAFLNQIFGVIIFLNCISGVVFHRLFRDSVIKQRVACLVCDVVLDFAWGAILPVWSAVPLLRIYDTISQLGANIDYTVNSTREVERVLMLSWGSYMLSIIPFCTSFLSTVELLAILREIVPDKVTEVVPFKASSPDAKIYSKSRIAPIKPWLRKLSSVVHVLMALYGVAVIGVSLTATQVFGSFESHAEYECLHRVNPWLSTKESCIGRKINCTLLSIRGNTTEIDQALEAFDPSTLSDLFFSDCEALQIPSTIRHFPRLQSFGVKHSTIVGWDNDAALTEAHFGGLKTLNLNNVSFLADADLTGLLSHELSPSVEWIHMNNIPDAAQRLLEPLNKRQLWREILYFDCDSCGLTTFPEIVLGMHQLVALSLLDNDLDEVSDTWGANGDLELQALWLDGNPRLAALPDAVWHASKTCEVVSLTYTNLLALPMWLPAQSTSGFSIAATGTPLCDPTHATQLSTELRALLVCKSG